MVRLNKTKKIEFGVLSLMMIIFMFLRVNFDPTLGGIFFSMIVFSFLMIITDLGKFQFPIIRQPVDIASLFTIVLVGYGAFLALATVLSTGFTAITGAGSLIELASQDTIPALSGSLGVRLLVFAVFISIVETHTFARIAELVMDEAKVSFKFNFHNIRMHLAFAGVAGLFALFHLSVGLASGGPTLILSFVFMLVSLWMIAFRKQTLEAISLHIFNNSFVFAVGAGIPIAQSIVGVLG